MRRLNQGILSISFGSGALVAVLILPAGAASAAPSQLFGKSVVVNWSEEREQRVGGSEIRNVARSGQFSVYLSSAGRPFSRMSYSFAAGKHGLKSGNRDAVGGESRRNISFHGSSMSVDMPIQGGARHIAVSFDSGFAGCSAQVLTGKETAGASIHGRSLINGAAVEMISVKTGPASCRIQDGNVFGN
jgi:hypothetical protein